MLQLPSFLTGILDSIGGALSWIEAQAIMKVLPLSPFTDFIKALRTDSIQKGLSWLNWLVPIGDFADIIKAWLAAIVVYYVYNIVLRALKVIE